MRQKLAVKENLEIYARLYGIKDLTNRILEISEDLNLNSFINKKTGELSSGQKNRVSLAKSLINKPKILFLDEPTASLDPDIGDFVRQYIENYKSTNCKFISYHKIDATEFRYSGVGNLRIIDENNNAIKVNKYYLYNSVAIM